MQYSKVAKVSEVFLHSMSPGTQWEEVTCLGMSQGRSPLVGLNLCARVVGLEEAPPGTEGPKWKTDECEGAM